MVYLIIVLLFFTVCFAAYSFSGFTLNGLPVLMYHSVSDSDSPDDLTVTVSQIESQFRYLIKKKYTPIFLSDLVEYKKGNRSLPRKPILLTFDDGYKNNYTCLYPLLKEYRLKATIFLVAGFIQSDDNNLPAQPQFLHLEDIRNMSGDTIQFGLHSYDHKSYNDLTIPEIEEDIKKCKLRLDHLQIPYQPCFAYTYGAYPKKDLKKREQLFNILGANGIQLAFRIGNRLNKFPLENKFLIQRIDIRGGDSPGMFKFALLAGKKILLK